MSPKQQAANEVYEYIRKYVDAQGRAPSIRMIGAALGLSRHTVSSRIAWLQGEGRVKEGTTKPL